MENPIRIDDLGGPPVLLVQHPYNIYLCSSTDDRAIFEGQPLKNKAEIAIKTRVRPFGF